MQRYFTSLRSAAADRARRKRCFSSLQMRNRLFRVRRKACSDILHRCGVRQRIVRAGNDVSHHYRGETGGSASGARHAAIFYIVAECGSESCAQETMFLIVTEEKQAVPRAAQGMQRYFTSLRSAAADRARRKRCFSSLQRRNRRFRVRRKACSDILHRCRVRQRIVRAGNDVSHRYRCLKPKLA
ncbi:hypothetical protein [Paenibacillus aceris]|uniref:Uncharacterized protein n=1 Tax=Paenibacillus aceris TaxID=869555 RepID=A0ABS4HSI9_9BACL|nr:hypothetical protein [Paenibacillus aceris]MBP1961585.1 hypothetical protein [Paenibacillus aceris]